MADQARYAVDAGGSHSTVRICHRDGTQRTWQGPSCAIATVGEPAAVRALGGMLAEIAEALAGEEPLLGCIASSSFPVGGEALPPQVLIDAITDSPCRGQAFVVNDVVPLLWAPPLRGHGLVVNSGTGSAVLGRRRDGRFVKLGGHEHILSDQGSAYSLAREGLRAATRAVDGLGPATQLVQRAESCYGRALPELGRWLAELTRARAEVARFAPQVIAAAEAQDLVAGAIVEVEAAALGQTAMVGIESLDLGPAPTLGLAGGVLRGSGLVRNRVLAELTRAGLRPAATVLDGMAAALDFVGPAGAGGTPLLAPLGGLVLEVAGRPVPSS